MINFINIPAKYQPKIKKIVARFIQKHHLNPASNINIELVTRNRIRALNKKYRQIDKETDVLSFPIWRQKADIPKTGQVALGDIMIAPEKDNLDAKIEMLIEHSLNHLVGKHH